MSTASETLHFMHKVKSLKVLLCKLSPDAETLSQTCSIYDPEYCPLKGYDAIVMNVDLNLKVSITLKITK